MKKRLLPKDHAFFYDAVFSSLLKAALLQKSHQVTDLF